MTPSPRRNQMGTVWRHIKSHRAEKNGHSNDTCNAGRFSHARRVLRVDSRFDRLKRHTKLRKCGDDAIVSGAESRCHRSACSILVMQSLAQLLGIRVSELERGLHVCGAGLSVPSRQVDERQIIVNDPAYLTV